MIIHIYSVKIWQLIYCHVITQHIIKEFHDTFVGLHVFLTVCKCIMKQDLQMCLVHT